MPINPNVILIYDLETTSPNPATCWPIEIGAMAVDPRTLEPLEGGTFESMMGYSEEFLEGLDQTELNQALRVNGKTRDQIVSAPNHKIVWSNFVAFVNRFNNEKDNKRYTAPLLAGFNIDGFDTIILKRLAAESKNLDNRGNLNFVHMMSYDLYKIVYSWFDEIRELDYLNMDFLRDYFGIPKDGAHSALKDCKDELWLLRKFLFYQRNLSSVNVRKHKYKGSFDGYTWEQ